MSVCPAASNLGSSTRRSTRAGRLQPTSAAPRFRTSLLLGSGVLASLSHQGCDKGAEEGFAAAPSVVHELEEAEIERQLLLRDTPVRAEPRAQQGPRPLHRVDVDL